MNTASTTVIRAADEPEYWFQEGCFIVEWLNRDDDPAVSVARARVPPRSRTRRHRLQGTVERYLILSGRGRIALGREKVFEADLGMFEADLGPGDACVIPAGTDQRITNLGDEDLVFLAICTPRFTPRAYQDTEDGAAW